MTEHSQAAQQTRTLDPDHVPEVVCDGNFNVAWSGNRAVITFTHPRAKAQPLFEQGIVDNELIVRARIATSVDNLRALRDSLNQLFPADQTPDQTPTSNTATGRLH